jgi:hypothetical protein
MEIWFQTARATRDLDFTLKAMPTGTADAILASLQDIGAQDICDLFTFPSRQPPWNSTARPMAAHAIRWKQRWRAASS